MSTGPAALLGALVLTSALAFSFLGSKSFWLDEGYSVSFASLPLSRLAGLLADSQANGGLYYVLLHFWLKAGDSEVWVRTLSVLAVLATVPFIHGLASRAFGRKAGILAPLLFGLNAFAVQYAQEARAYAFALLLVTASTYLLMRAAEAGSTWRWAAYAVVSALAVYAHFFALLVLGSHALALAVLLIGPDAPISRSVSAGHSFGALLSRAAVAIRQLVAVYAGTVVLLLPLAIFVLTTDSRGQIGWVPTPTLLPTSVTTPSLVGTLEELSGAGGPLLLVLYLLLSGIALAALVRDWRRRAMERLDVWRRLLIVAWLVIPLLSTFVVSFVKPVFVSRFLIVALPPFVLLAAAGLALVRPRWLFGLALVAVAALSVRAAFLWYEDYRKENWRAAVSYVLSNAQSGDRLVFIPSRMRTPFQVYVEMREADVSTPTPLYPPGDWDAWDAVAVKPGPLDRYLPASERLWVVMSHGDVRERSAAEGEIEEDYRLVLVRRYAATPHVTERIGTGIELRLYQATQ